MLGYINSFFSICGLKLSLFRKHECSNINKTNYYKIECSHNVDELLENRINKGYHFEDNDQIFIKPSTINGYNFIYKEMINHNHMDIKQHESDEDSDVYDPTPFYDILRARNGTSTE